jgi:hypothetical protein
MDMADTIKKMMEPVAATMTTAKVLNMVMNKDRQHKAIVQRTACGAWTIRVWR